jgi:hypothetical protein
MIKGGSVTTQTPWEHVWSGGHVGQKPPQPLASPLHFPEQLGIQAHVPSGWQV